MSGITLALILVISVLVALGAGTLIGVFYRKMLGGRHLTEAEAKATLIVDQAEQEKKTVLLDAKEEAIQVRSSAESELRDRRREMQRQENRLTQREENLDRRVDSIEGRERGLGDREQRLEEAQTEVDDLKEKQLKEKEKKKNRDRVFGGKGKGK